MKYQVLKMTLLLFLLFKHSLSACPNCNIYCFTNSCTSSCNPGYELYWEGTVGKCRLICTSPCSECSGTATSCTNCIANYYLIGNNCLGCNSPCTSCTGTATTCTGCISGKYLIWNSCLDCISPCTTCTGTATTCTGCIDGKYLSGNSCLDCTSPCAKCSQSATHCDSCVDPSKMTLTANQCQCKSMSEYALNGVCISCPQHCETCDQYRCYTCKSPCSSCDHYNCLTCTTLQQYVNQNTCLDCPSHCLACTQNECQICQLPCLTCDNYQCLTCLETNQYVFQTTCQNCPDHCLTCTQNDCLTCLSPCLTFVNRLTNISLKLLVMIVQIIVQLVHNQHVSPARVPAHLVTTINAMLVNYQTLELTCVHCLTCDQDNCFTCANNCLTCTHTECLSCLNDNQYIIEKECFDCPDHCLTCDQNTCSTCVFPCETCDHAQCLTCQFSNYYPQEQTCQECPDHCLTCDGQQCFKCIGDCLKCDFNECLLCPDRQYSLGIECFQCQNNCQSCNQIGCLICDPGYFIDYALQCQIKIKTNPCGNGFLEENEECDDGNLLDQDGCNSLCQIEDNFICQGSQCIKNEIETSISVVYLNSTTTNEFYVFMSGITDPQCNLIRITIQQFDQKDFKYDSEKILRNSTHLICSLKLLLYKTILKQNLIKFIYSSDSNRYLTEIIAQITIVPRQQRYYDEAQMEQSKQVGLAQEKLSQTIFYLGPTAVLLGGFQIFWNILDILSWLNNLYFINVEYPQNTKVFFQKCQWADLQLIPNLYELESPVESPPKFMEKDIGPVFLNNIGMLVSILGCIIIGYILSFVFQKIIYWLTIRFYLKRIVISKNPIIFKLKDFSQKTHIENQGQENPQTKYKIINKSPQFLKILLKKSTLFREQLFSNIISTINLSMLDIVLAICLQLTSIHYDILNFTFTIFGVVICLIILRVSFKQLERHHTLLDNYRYKQLYGTFYESINTKSRIALQYQYLSLLKKIIFIVILVSFYENPILQTTLCCLSQFPAILILITNNPFNNKKQYLQYGVPDICLFFVLLILVGIAVDDIILILSEDGRFFMGWIIIAFIGCSISIQLVFIIKDMFLDMYHNIIFAYNKFRKLF